MPRYNLRERIAVIRTSIVGLGKMGLSHLAMLRAHSDLEIVGACDSAGYLLDVLRKHTAIPCFGDFDKMLYEARPEALLVATPSSSHARLVRQALERGIHVFCEKPFVLNVADGEELAALAAHQSCVTQVGYHYRFVGAFREAARIVASGALGKIHHVRAEAYGPVVLREKGATWRSAKSEGGGALYDYACHAVDLVHFIAGVPDFVSGVVRRKVFSTDVDDEIYCSLHYLSGASGQLCVNWSDESFRKMATKISVWGTNGRVTADRQECQIYLREVHDALPATGKGWTVRYTTELTDEVAYYLRGEEYSAQIAYWAESISMKRMDGENSFHSALATDRVVAMIASESAGHVTRPVAESGSKLGLLSRLLGRS
jgi:scyllo-inositol 2-dehydrogenase (NADP+)